MLDHLYPPVNWSFCSHSSIQWCSDTVLATTERKMEIILSKKKKQRNKNTPPSRKPTQPLAVIQNQVNPNPLIVERVRKMLSTVTVELGFFFPRKRTCFQSKLSSLQLGTNYHVIWSDKRMFLYISIADLFVSCTLIILAPFLGTVASLAVNCILLRAAILLNF